MSTCTRPDGCRPECRFSTMKAFCEHLNSERTAGDHVAACIKRWESLPEWTRQTALDHLRMSLTQATGEGGRKALAKWKDQKRRGIECGSNDIRFHFSGGMAVRNILRQVIHDDRLPEPRNWDEYYYGAIDALAGEP